jgi:hypothetical protein
MIARIGHAGLPGTAQRSPKAISLSTGKRRMPDKPA